MLKGHTELGVVTGKPVELGGSRGRQEATARGCLFAIREVCKVKNLRLDGATVAVQGYGNAGSIVARLLQEDGARIIAVSDSSGGIFNQNGLDPTTALHVKQETGSVANYPDADRISNAELIELKCDLLVPAALENQITIENAGRIQAKLVAEAANGPTTPGADRILFDRGITVIPDILANAGGVTVSYFEWVQNLYTFFWDENEVNVQLERKMTTAFHDVLARSQEHQVDLRTGAYILAIARVADATRVRGIFP
jgi:glutamate dehydrogenase/leucine dehydrogenase